MLSGLERKISIEWIIDKAWPLFWLLAGGFITSTTITATEIIKPYGAAVILIISIAGAYAFLGFYYLFLRSVRLRISNRYAESVTRKGDANPLDNEFSKKIIKINDFYDPYYYPHKNKSFTGCNIIGPGSIYFIGGAMTTCSFKDCQIVIVKDDIYVTGVTILETCTISNSRIVNCTLLMTRSMFQGLPAGLRDSILVLNG